MGYSLVCRKKVEIIAPFKTIKRRLPNGNVTTMVCGNSKNGGKVCTIVSNAKAKKGGKKK